MSNNGKSRSSSRHHFLAGLTTGCISASLLQPADLLKTRLQQSHSAALLPTLRTILAQPNAVRNLWRGTLPSVVRTGVGSALYFSTLNTLRVKVAAAAPSPANSATTDSSLSTSSPVLGGTRSTADNGGISDKSRHPSISTPQPVTSSSTLPTLSTTQNLLTGALARASAGFVMMPITVLKVRYESSLYSYPSLWSASKDIMRKEGIRGFFSGYGATAVRDAPYAGLYVVFYEGCKARLGNLTTQMNSKKMGSTAIAGEGEITSSKLHEHQAHSSQSLKGMLNQPSLFSSSQSMTINFTSGALAAIMATTVTNPFDAVKTRLQLMPGKYGNTFQAIRMIFRQEGVRSFFDGLGLRVGRKALSSALAWTGYEELVRRVESRVAPV